MPRGRVDLIDIRARAADAYDRAFDQYARCAYCSLHTTAGYLPPRLVARLQARSQAVDRYVAMLRRVFPEGAGYLHDKMVKRDDLTPAQRQRDR